MGGKQHSLCTLIAQMTEDVTTCKGRAFPRCVTTKDKNEKKEIVIEEGYYGYPGICSVT